MSFSNGKFCKRAAFLSRLGEGFIPDLETLSSVILKAPCSLQNTLRCYLYEIRLTKWNNLRNTLSLRPLKITRLSLCASVSVPGCRFFPTGHSPGEQITNLSCVWAIEATDVISKLTLSSRCLQSGGAGGGDTRGRECKLTQIMKMQDKNHADPWKVQRVLG